MAWSYTVSTGLVDTTDSFSDELPIDMSNVIAMLDVDESQFTTMLMKLPSDPATQIRSNWLEDSFLPNYTTVATCATSIAVDIVVTTGTATYAVTGDVIRNLTAGDAYLVTATVGTTALSVARAIGQRTASAAATGDLLLIVGQSSAQGADLPRSLITRTQSNYNYQQIVRHHAQFTNTNTAIDRYGGSQPNREKGKHLIHHKRALEQIAFFGARNLVTSGSEPQGQAGGLFDYLTTNRTNVSGTLSATAFDVQLQNIFAHGSKNKVAFCGPTARRALSGFLRSAWQPPTVGDKKYGAVVDGYVSGAYGYDLPIMVKRNWNEVGAAGMIFVVDLDYVKARPLRPTKYIPVDFERTTGADKFSFEYKTEVTFEIRQESVHGLLFGITG